MNTSCLRMNGWYSLTTGKCYEKKDRIVSDTYNGSPISGGLSGELHP